MLTLSIITIKWNLICFANSYCRSSLSSNHSSIINLSDSSCSCFCVLNKVSIFTGARCLSISNWICKFALIYNFTIAIYEYKITWLWKINLINWSACSTNNCICSWNKTFYVCNCSSLIYLLVDNLNFVICSKYCNNICSNCFLTFLSCQIDAIFILCEYSTRSLDFTLSSVEVSNC